MILSRPTRSLEYRTRRHRRTTFPYVLDRAVSPFVRIDESLLVSGFWRSGTTWLQQTLAEIMDAKTVFEPLMFVVPDMAAIYAAADVSGRDRWYKTLFFPFAGGFQSAAVLRLYADAVRSRSRGRWVRRLRSGAAESFKRRVVLKVIRGHLSAAEAQRALGTPLIHIVRDPRAVIGSVKISGWDQIFDTLSLKEQLLEPEDGRADFFGQWRTEIERYDRADKLIRLAAYWALTEAYAHACRANGEQLMVFASYEELLEGKQKAVCDVLDRLGVPYARGLRSSVIHADSRSTTEARRGASDRERIAGWKRVLSEREASTIEAIAREFGLSHTLVAA